LFIKKNHRLSLQYHKYKQETIRVLEGTLKLILNDNVVVMRPGDNVTIFPNDVHRMIAYNEDTLVLEVSTTELQDICRLEDDYSRHSS